MSKPTSVTPTRQRGTGPLAESLAVRIGGPSLPIVLAVARRNGMTARATVEEIIRQWKHTEDGVAQPGSGQAGDLGAAMLAKVKRGKAPVQAAVDAIRETLPFTVSPAPKRNGKVKTGVGKPQGAPARKGASK